MERDLKELREAMEEFIEKTNKCLPVHNNFRFRNEEEALHHASLFAQLQPGAFVTFRDANGMHKGVVMQFDKHCRVQIIMYDPDDGGFCCGSITTAAILFDNMPPERDDACACKACRKA